MDANVIIGGLAVLFGVVTGVGRVVAPDSAMFSKLEPMKERFGERGGVAIHVAAYTVGPLAFGGVLIASSLMG